MRLSWERLLGWLLCKLLEGGPGRSLKKAAFFNRFCKNDEPRRRRSGGGGGGAAAAAAGSCWGDFIFQLPTGTEKNCRHFFTQEAPFLGDAPVRRSWEAPSWEAPS